MIPLYVGYVSSGRVFPLISSLPSSLSADVLSVFVRMIHQYCPLSDSSQTYMRAVWPKPLPPSCS